MRAAALRAAYSRTTQQVFDARNDQAGNCVYCSKKERSDELIPRSSATSSSDPHSGAQHVACTRNLPHTIRTSLTAGLTGAAQRPRARASGTRTPAYLPRSPAWLCSELSCLRPALSCLQLL